jgi:acetyltransferase-like isoleucine patch superfamily enzyme
LNENRLLEIIYKIYQLSEKSQNKKIIIFGVSVVGKEVSMILKIFKINHFFVDNNIDLWGKKYLDIQVENPAILSELKRGEFIVLITSAHSYEISFQLEGMSLENEVDFYLLYSGAGYRYQSKINGVEIGKHSYGFFKHCYPGTLLSKVGAFCSINETAKMGFINHPTNYITTHPFIYAPEYGLVSNDNKLPLSQMGNNESIEIGNDVWIGAGVLILPSVKIGNGAIVGAGAVVNKDVPDYAIVVGVPAKVIKYRFSDIEIDMLNKIQWWNWSDDKIKRYARDFLNNNDFFKRHFM